MQGYRAWIVGLVLLGTAAYGQDQSFAVVLRGNFTTGSELFPEPNSPDPAARARSLSMNGIPGAGLEFRFFPRGADVAVGLSADYLSTSENLRIAGLPRTVPAEDGYRVIPVELTGYFLLPFSNSSLGAYMGGGAGAYFGRRVTRIAGVEALPLTRKAGFGIHVLGGVLLRLSAFVSLHADMKFRDVQFETTTVFPVAQTVYDGIPVALDREPRVSRVHVDGIVFQLGTALSW